MSRLTRFLRDSLFCSWVVVACGFALTGVITLSFRRGSARETAGAIPRVWDDEALASLEVPLAVPEASPKFVSSDWYYKIPVRPIYKSYPIYRPDKEPPGYMDWLKQQEPEIAYDSSKLKTKEEWIKAGEIVFDASLYYDSRLFVTTDDVLDPAWFEKLKVPVSKEGALPFVQYVIRQKGKVEVGEGSCNTCHTRVMPDGTVVKGTQGNVPYSRIFAYALRRVMAESKDQKAFQQWVRYDWHQGLGVPWLRPDPAGDVEQMTIDQIATLHEAIPPGIAERVDTSLRYPPSTPTLFGVRDRHYLDHTGLIQQRSIADLMRYAALVQGGVHFERFSNFRINEQVHDPSTDMRCSDDQLYALALYLYSLQPPPNPNKFDDLAARGQKVFDREGCATCHTPPLYTNNKLTPAVEFQPPVDHFKRFEILPISVGTDSKLTLLTRVGTGYYKIPSLKDVWLRGPFEHNGSVATLEDWFDPHRLLQNYVPTGFPGAGVKNRAVPGHPYGLDLSEEDKRALIAFLKTL